MKAPVTRNGKLAVQRKNGGLSSVPDEEEARATFKRKAYLQMVLGSAL